MFARIKRFFTVFRILRQEAREEQEIYQELNLDKMGDLAVAAVPKPRGSAPADTMVLELIPGKEGDAALLTQKDVDRVLEESKVEYDNPCNRRPTSYNQRAEARLEKHDQKFRS